MYIQGTIAFFMHALKNKEKCILDNQRQNDDEKEAIYT